ncbi:unnamed protein product [Caenorhabditis auriculariae]|uniref:Uncharacterized protein n=1 Tax=Caenorhabditis auriculariae TaxID=2777116 RepID=A0A8S1H299_9PELO|nr:unnamed protein product [Caenorhabditis auriculariae]
MKEIGNTPGAPKWSLKRTTAVPTPHIVDGNHGGDICLDGPPGSQCSGPSKEKEPCSGKKEKKKVVPNYLWGSWTDWQQWSECDCGRDLTTRTRICRGESCEGCAKEYANCGEKACPSAKKWSPWTEWSSQGRKEIRYTAFCSTSRLNFAEVGFRTDERSKNFSATWSSWSLRAGVAFRHRLTSASDFEVDYQLISRSVRDCVPLNVVVVVGVVATVCGFLVQCISAHVFRRASRTRTDSFLYHCRSPGFPSLLSRKY